jgi:hypothetical protein
MNKIQSVMNRRPVAAVSFLQHCFARCGSGGSGGIDTLVISPNMCDAEFEFPMICGCVLLTPHHSLMFKST